MNQAVDIRPARPDEADGLSALALRSKAHWGYGPEFMAACRAELTVSHGHLISAACRYRVAELHGEIVAYYGLAKRSADVWELEAMFVEPSHIGRGIGRSLMAHAKETAAKAGAKELLVQSDPHAERFYRAAGGVSLGRRESASIPGRHLPLLSIRLTQD